MSDKYAKFGLALVVGCVTSGLSIGVITGHYSTHRWAELAIGYGVFGALMVGITLGLLIGGRDD